MVGDEAFLNSLELESHWYIHSYKYVRRQIRLLLLSYKDVFTTENKKVGLAKIGEAFRIELLPGSQPVHRGPEWPKMGQNL